MIRTSIAQIDDIDVQMTYGVVVLAELTTRPGSDELADVIRDDKRSNEGSKEREDLGGCDMRRRV